MTLSEFIKKLQIIESDGYGRLPVCVADWQENYFFPSEDEAAILNLAYSEYSPKNDGDSQFGDYVCIGDPHLKSELIKKKY